MQPSHRTPGQLIHELLEERGWTQNVLAVVLGCSKTAISMIIAGKRDVDAEMALALAEVFGVAAERFMELQASFELSRARITTTLDPSLARRAVLFGSLPLAEMLKRRWIQLEDLKEVDKVEAALARFFRVDSIDSISLISHAAKKSDVVGATTPTQLAWLHRVRQIAQEMVVPRYSREALLDALPKLSDLLSAPEEARHAPRILAEAGVRFLLVESLPSAKIDGACLWLNDAAPVVAMTLRYDRIDNFWFVLRHELEHVLRGHGRGAAIVDAELEGDRAGSGQDIPEEERQANEAASAFCVPKKDLDSFIARKQPVFADRDIIGFAAKRQLHPGLVAGQLRHRTKRWDLFSKHLVKIRFAIAPSATVDGWGDVAPVQQ
jgi:HTH-type transcriptional regulator/antitoxin HigA